jgi:hypothetical protein
MQQFPDAPVIRYLHVGNTEWVMVNSLQGCKEMLQTKCYAFEKPGWFRRVVGELAGIGLVNTEGDEHKRQRRLLTGAQFSWNIMKEQTIDMWKHRAVVDNERTKISASLQRKGSRTGQSNSEPG